MASFLAGQRLAAGHLNALATHTVNVSGGPTSGTDGLTLSGSITIPAAPIDRMATAILAVRLDISTTGDRFTADILINGARFGVGQLERDSQNFPSTTVLGSPVLLAAGSTMLVGASIARIAGSGTASTITAAANRLVVQLSPAP